MGKLLRVILGGMSLSQKLFYNSQCVFRISSVYICFICEQRHYLAVVSHSQLHTSELNDGYDWGRLNLQSVTEQSSMDDFLATAELAGTEFVAGKLYLT